MRDTAAEIMEVNTCIVRDTTTLADVATVLAHKGGQVVIMSSDEGKLTGIYTETDLARAFIKKTDPDTPMSKVMTKNPEYVEPDATLEHCADKMTQHGFRHLPVYDGTRILGMVRILTIQKELIGRLQDSITKLERRDEYLAVVAHDMRSPMAAAHSCCELLKMAEEDDDDGYSKEERLEILERISESTESALSLMTNMLDIGNLNNGLKLELQEAPVESLLEKMIANHKQLAKRRGVSIEVNVPEGLLASVDQKRYGEIVSNLLDNALKFSPENGTISVTANIGEREFLEVAITDQGPGIPKERLKQIFVKHEQLETDIKRLGFGLGLSIALQFALHHGGRIKVDSELGKGSTFTILTPDASIAN